MEVDKILDERGTRYGKYIEQCEISHDLRNVIEKNLAKRALELAVDQEDALMMIQVKISRIINGDPDYADNWKDIAGYATLVADRLEGNER